MYFTRRITFQLTTMVMWVNVNDSNRYFCKNYILNIAGSKQSIRLRGCAGWSAPLLFAFITVRFSSISGTRWIRLDETFAMNTMNKCLHKT